MTNRHKAIPNAAELRVEIGARLAEARISAGLSVSLASARMGWQTARLEAIERGEIDVTVAEASGLARLYGIGLGYMARGPGSDDR